MKTAFDRAVLKRAMVLRGLEVPQAAERFGVSVPTMRSALAGKALNLATFVQIATEISKVKPIKLDSDLIGTAAPARPSGARKPRPDDPPPEYHPATRGPLAGKAAS